MALRAKDYRDKEKLRKTRNAQRNRYYRKTSIYPPREWTCFEIEEILARSFRYRIVKANKTFCSFDTAKAL